MYTARIHVLVNRGFIAFFAAMSLLNTVDAQRFTILGSGLMALCALILIAISVLPTASSKMVQTVFLGGLGYFMVATNNISEYEGIILLGIVLLMSWQYGYLRNRVIMKGFLFLTLLLLVSLIAGYNLMHAPDFTGTNVIFDIVSNALLIVAMIYQVVVLAFLPALRRERRAAQLERQSMMQSRYHSGDIPSHERPRAPKDIVGGTFFALRGDASRQANLAKGGTGVTIYSAPDEFIPLSRDEIITLIREMRITPEEVGGYTKNMSDEDDVEDMGMS